MSGAKIMKTSQWRRAAENRCVFSARLKAVSDRSGYRSVLDCRVTMLIETNALPLNQTDSRSSY